MAGAISPLTSERLAALRFPLIVLVIYIHARQGTITFGDMAVSVPSASVDTIKAAISDGVARSAVPLFFLLSGYLLFYGQQRWSWRGFRQKLERRIGTLVVPYLFWNVALFVLVLVALMTPLRVFFNSFGRLLEMGWPELATWVLGLQRYPIAYQFWFIRDLIILVLLSPAIFAAARRRASAAVVLAVLLACWLFDRWPLSIPSIEAVPFFFLGVVAGVHSHDLFRGPPLALIAPAYAALLAGFLVSRGTSAEPLVQHAVVAAGMLLAFAIVRNLPSAALARVAALANASFFVFATHEPLTTMLLKIGYRVLPVSAGMALALYLLTPVVVILATLALYRSALAVAPRLTRRVTGR